MTKYRAIELLKESSFERVTGYSYNMYRYKAIHFDCSNEHTLDVMAITKDDRVIPESDNVPYKTLNNRFAVRYAKLADKLGSGF